jgi:hypothetical protein
VDKFKKHPLKANPNTIGKPKKYKGKYYGNQYFKRGQNNPNKGYDANMEVDMQ